MTVDEIIKRALRLIEAVPAGREPTASQAADALLALKAMMASSQVIERVGEDATPQRPSSAAYRMLAWRRVLVGYLTAKAALQHGESYVRRLELALITEGLLPDSSVTRSSSGG